MRWTSIAYGLLAAVVMSSSSPEAFSAKRPPRDVIRSHPDLDRLKPQEIALLPAVMSFQEYHYSGERWRSPSAPNVDVLSVKRIVEYEWLQFFYESGHQWRSSTYARERMRALAKKPDSLHDEVARVVFRDGHLDSARVVQLTRAIGVQSIMTLRIDRWERADTRIATIELTGALMDSSGRLLWKAMGASSVDRLPGTPSLPGVGTPGRFVESKYPFPGSGSSVPGRPGASPASQAVPTGPADFLQALHALLSRWVVQFPSPPERGRPGS